MVYHRYILIDRGGTGRGVLFIYLITMIAIFVRNLE